MNESVAIAAHDLTRVFGDFVAVDHVTFSVPSGQIFGFLGPNGAGKTTTIKMLTGLLRPSGGIGSVVGFDIAGQTEDVKRHIGYMSQLFSLYADLTVEENINFFAGLYGVAGPRIPARRDWVLRMAGLTDQRRRLTGELPLGWKQRLALGCAVLHEPPVLFLDEPTSGVDPVTRRRFWDLINSLADGGTTVLVSTHYMEEAEYCHRLALMNRGRVIALDTPARLRGGMREPILEIVTEHGLAVIEAIGEFPGVRSAGLFGRAVHVRLDPGETSAEQLAAHLRSRGIHYAAIEAIVPSLEDVFIARVQAAGGAPMDG